MKAFLLEVGLLSLLIFGLSNTSIGVEVYIQDHKTNAILYHQRSSEYAALTYQGYNIARKSLDFRLLALPSGFKPAVVVDVDETLLSNAPYEAKLLINNQSYPMGFEEWIQAAVAAPVPGSLEFLTYAHQKGVKVFYVTNRKSHQHEATKKNLIRAGFPDVSDETVLTRTDTSSKELRRESIRKQYEILLLIGDNLVDLAQQFEVKESAQRLAEVEKAKEHFGGEFIMIPNAIYGDWEGVAGDLTGMNPEQKRTARLKALVPYSP